MEFLVRTHTRISELEPDRLAELRAAERVRAIELHRQGALVRLWRVPGQQATLGLYDVAGATELHDILSSLPLFPWMDVHVECLARHPMEVQLATTEATSENGGSA